MFRFFVTCARGTEGALRRELAAMRIAGAKGDRGGVWFEGPLEMGTGVCLWSRVAVRVLVQLATFEASDARSLYAGAHAIRWPDWLTAKSTFAVHASIRTSAEPDEGRPRPVERPREDPRAARANLRRRDPRRGPASPRSELRADKPRAAQAVDRPGLHHSGFVALKVKDAVADTLREALGARPDVDTQAPDVSIVVHLAEGKVGVFLDLAGEPLHRRGHRVAMVDAPLKETLAAAVLALGGADPEAPFVDPMCGSGTLAIEHALAVRGIAPGLRRRFGFETWPTLPAETRAAWTRARAAAEAAALEAADRPAPPILCADLDPKSVTAARQNAAAAGVDNGMTFEQADVATLERRWPVATLATNPPYGERLQPAELETLYRTMGSVFGRLGGWRAIVLSGNPLFGQAVRRKAEVSHRLWNGPLEVRLLRYDL